MSSNKHLLRNQLIGWVLFILCAVLFIISGIRNGDTYALVASIVFLFACFLFIIPPVNEKKVLPKKIRDS